MYCYVCLIHLKQGNTLSYSYKNALNTTITGTVTGLTNTVVALVDTILGTSGNKEIGFTDKDGNPMGVFEQTNVRGVSLCIFHVVGGQVS